VLYAQYAVAQCVNRSIRLPSAPARSTYISLTVDLKRSVTLASAKADISVRQVHAECAGPSDIA